MQLDQEWDDVEVDEGGIDPNDFSHYLETDEVLRGFAMIALKRGYEMIDAGEDQGVVAEALVLLFHESEVPDAFDIFSWASDYFENVDWNDFMNNYVSSPAEVLFSEEEAGAIRESLDRALEQTQIENA